MIEQVRVLYADDIPLSASFWKKDFEEAGFSCRTVHSETDALKEMNLYHPHVVITDWGLSPGDMREPLDRTIQGLSGGSRLIWTILHEYDEHVRTILMSGNKLTSYLVQNSGAWGYYCKDSIHDYKSVLMRMIRGGLLTKEELHKPSINIESEMNIFRFGKER